MKIGLNMEELQLNQTLNKLNDTTFRGEISSKDLVLEVGDEKQVDFKPRFKLKKWDNEVNFSVGVIEDIGVRSSFTKEGEKIVWSQGNEEAHFYPKEISKGLDEGGFEFEVILKEKPVSNIVELSIQTKELDFFYQPFLTEEELLANPGDSRPENVEGSYAVYHKSKQGDYSKMGGKNYQTGKAFHIYRPKIVDADGKWAWGKLSIDVEKERLYIEIPQSILDNGTYPLIVDPTFGYSTAGTSGLSSIADTNGKGIQFQFMVGSAYSLTEAGSVSAVSVGLKLSANFATTVYYTACIYREDGNGANSHSLISSAEGSGILSTTVTFYNIPLSTSLAADDYILSAVGNSEQLENRAIQIAYDSATGVNYYQDTSDTDYIPDDPWNKTENGTNRKYSIYATYTAEESGTEYTLDCSATSFSLTGKNTTFTRSRTLTASATAFSFTAINSILSYRRTLIASATAFAVTGINAIITSARHLTASATTFAITGVNALLTRNWNRALSVTSFAVTEVNAILSHARTLTASATSFSVSAVNANISHVRTFIASATSFTVTGISASFHRNWNRVLSAAGFTVTSVNTGLSHIRTLTANAASFAVTGIPTVLAHARNLIASATSFSITGQNADLAYTEFAGTVYTLVCETTEFVGIGINAGLSRVRTLAVSAATFTVTGIISILSRGYRLAAGATTFTVSTIQTGLSHIRTLTADVTDFTVTGINALFYRNLQLSTATTNYQITGQNIELVYHSTKNPYSNKSNPFSKMTDIYSNKSKPYNKYH